jgi:PPOX class probable F420-dependent enzyme
MARLSHARVARLATITMAGRPHIVPIVFAVDGDTLYFAVDSKPKRTTDLKRLRNIAANPAVSILVDDYNDTDWARLWWVRVDGIARLADHDEAEHAIALLAVKYPQHRATPPAGPVTAVMIERVTEWSGADPAVPHPDPARRARA